MAERTRASRMSRGKYGRGKYRMGKCRDCADGTDAEIQLKLDGVYVPLCVTHYNAELDRLIRRDTTGAVQVAWRL